MSDKIPFDYLGAKKAGYSDDEIRQHLSKEFSFDFDIAGAKKSGYSDTEIADYILSAPTPKKKDGGFFGVDLGGIIPKIKETAVKIATNIKGQGGEIKTPEYPRTAGEVPTQVSQKEVEPIFKPTVGAVSESTSVPKIDVKAIREQKAYEKKIADETPKEIPYFGGALGTTLRAIDSEYSPIGQLGVGDFIDDMGRAIASGVNQGDIVTPANALLLAGKNASPEQIQKYIEAAKDYEKIGASDEMMKFSKTYQDEGKTIYGFLKGLAENPGVVGELIVSSVSAMANPSSLAAAGAVTGGFATSGAVGGGAPGATAGAISSIPWAIGAAGTALETGLTFSELLNDKLKENNLDFTEENVRALLEDEKTLKDIRTKSLARGATIGAIDALTGRLAGKVGAKLVGNTAASRVKAGLAASGIEMVGGSIGEASGRLVAGQPMDVAEIGLEGIAEGPMAIADITSEVLRRPIYKVNGEKRTEADVEEIINTSSPEELSKINIDIKNDVKGYKNKIENIVLNNEMRNEIRQANPKADDATIDTLLGLENELKTFENNKTQSGKERASSIRSQIKTIQQDVAQKQEVVKPVSEAVKLTPEVPELTLTEQLSNRMAEIESEEKGAAGEVAPEVPQPTKAGSVGVGGDVARKAIKINKFAKNLNESAEVLKAPDGKKAYNYVSKEGVEVTLTEDENGGYVNGNQVQGDIMLDFIGNDKKRGEGSASKELDRIIAEADKNDMSISLVIDSDQAIRGTESKKGLSNKELKKWYESKGFIFDRDSRFGYRPKATEDASIYKKPEYIAKKGEVTNDNIEYHSSPEDLQEAFDQSRIKEGTFHEDGDGYIYKVENGKLAEVKNVKYIPYENNKFIDKIEYTEAKPKVGSVGVGGVPAAEKVEQLRAAEQAEYAAMADPNDEVKRKEIYDRYDKLITPLLEKEKAESKAAPDELSRTLKSVGENTTDKNLLATSSGLIIHAGDTKIDKLDLSKVKGGARGIYGKGIYFTDSPYKAADYGGEFTYLDKSKLSIIDTKETINQDFVKSIKDVAKKFERAGDIEKSFAYNLFAEKLQAEINGERSIDDAWKNVRDRFAVDKTNTWNSLLKDLGYDTIKNGYEYVVFDADNGNAALVKDANSYISEAYYKGDNSKLTKSVNELLGIKEEVVPTKQEVPAAALVPSIIKVKSPKEVKQGDTVVWRGEDFTVEEVNSKGGFNLRNVKDRTNTVTDARITDEEFQGKRGEVAAAPAVQKFGVGFAPFREKNVFTEEEDVDIRNSPDYQLHQENVQKVAEGLGIKINNKLDTWGGYVDSETGNPVQEVSNIMEIEATPEQARVMAAILGKAAPEMQDSVLLGNYNEQGAGLEHIVKTGSFANAKEAIKLLKDNGLQYFSVDKNSGDVIILDLDATDTPKIVNLVKQLNENGIPAKHKYGKVNAEFIGSGDYDGIIEAERGRIGAETGFDIDAFVQEAAGKYDAIKAAAKPVVPEKTTSDEVANDLLNFLGIKSEEGDVKFSKTTGQPEVIRPVDEKEKEIVDRMNSMNLVNEGVDLDAPSTTDEKIDVEELNSRLSTPLPVANWDDFEGMPFAFTISDQLRSGDVVNPSTGEVITDLKGGIGFNGTEGNEGNAWANTSKDEAEALLSRALDVYGANKPLFEKLWADGKLPDGHVPVAVVKMAESAILSNEAVFRVGIQNIETLPERNRQKAVLVLNKTIKQKSTQLSKDIKRGTDAKIGAPYSENTLKAKKKLLSQYNKILDVINKYGYKDIVEVLKDGKHFSLPEKAIITSEVFYGAPTPIGGKPIDIARSRPSTPVSVALIGNKNPELINIGRITDLLTEPSMKNVPNMHVVSIVGIDVKNPQTTETNHPNYKYGVKGQSIGILGSPVHMKDAFGEAYGSAIAQVTKNEASNASINAKQAMTQGIPVQAGLPNRVLKGAIAKGKLDIVDKLAGFLRQAFPSTTFFTSQEAWDAAMADPSIGKKLKDGEVVYAFTKDGNVFINPSLKTTKAALHETGHIWMEFIKESNPELYNKGLSLVDGTKEFEKAKEQYGDTELAREEALMELMSSKGDTIVNASQKAKFKEWLLSIYKYVSESFTSLLGLSPKEIENLTLDKFLEGMLVDILSGKEVTSKKVKTQLKLSAESTNDRIKKFIQLQREKGISDEDIRAGVEKVAKSVGLSKSDIDNLMTGEVPTKTKEDAVQEQAADEVSVQPKAGVSGKVEGRVPAAKPKEAAKEGEAKGEEAEVTPGEMVGIKHESTEKMRTAYSLPEYDRPEGKTMLELEAEADKMIKDGYDVEALIKKLENAVPPSGVENIILAKYLGVLNADFDKTKNKEALTKIERVVNALDIIGTIQSEAFRTRKIMKPKEDTLAQYFMDEKADAGVEELTEEQEATITREYEEIKAAKEALQKKVEELQEQNAKLLAEGNIADFKKKVKKTRKTDSDFRQERKSIVNDIREKLKKARTEQKVAVVPYAYELVSISPEIAKLVKSYVEQGIVNLADIVDGIHEMLKEDIKDITKKDVQDLIAGEYQEKKKTKNELAAKVRDLKTEAELLNKYEKLKEGEVPVKEEKKIERNRKLTELRNQIKESDVTKLAQAKESLNNRIAKIEKQLAEGDFEKAPEKKVIKLDEEGRKLQAKLTKLKKERDVRRLTLQYQKQNKVQRAFNKVLEVFNIPRSLMASTDFSAPLNQAVIATINYPKEAKDAAVQMVKSAASQEAFDNWFYDLKETPRYELMKKLKLGITDPFNPELTAREEAFMSGYAEQIPGLGRLVKGSERAYVQYLNKLRVDLFNRFIDKFEADGKTYENSKKLYESTAKYINNITGRGELGKLQKFAPLFNTLFFSPRLMAARLNMLNPYYFATLPTELKKQYGKDMGTALGLLSTMLTLFALYGKTQDDDDEDKITVETDPRSSDFARVKQGDSRWDFSGGFQPYLRATSQYFSGQRKKTSTGEIMELEGKVPGTGKEDILISFFRNKLAPVPAMIWDFSTGKNAVGEKVELKDELLKNVIPLSFQSIYEGYEKKGPQALATVGLPAIFGVGVSTYEQRKKEVPESIVYQDRRIELNEEQRAEFQRIFDERNGKNIEKLKSLPEYKNADKIMRGELEQLVENKSLSESKEILGKKYRRDFLMQPKEIESREEKRVKQRFRID